MSINLLRDIRSFRVVVIHPQDAEAEELLRQLHRIGCQARSEWPPPKDRPSGVDLIFLDMTQLLSGQGRLAWSSADDGPPIVAVLDYESPTVLKALVDYGVRGFVSKPIRAFGLLTTMFMAHRAAEGERGMRKRLQKVEQRLDGIKKVSKAKAILIEQRRITEEEAYRFIRDRAMARRTTIEAVAAAIIDASEMLMAENPTR
ncbi:ANTAR domain-containing protein [Azospirillum palustre]|uniref:ANTAR domain-containing protein n=1 Tax=Azospirillum palustre TaxID=2044885 RepID=A0A2B8BEL1_9PROT|nr:ANTAR domain-containing protein [Azospirillum palustre]PGH56351.1 ANTAR domain-containing protein [Azospirillum palustre]